MLRRLLPLALAAGTLIASGLATGAAQANDKLTVLLDWFVNPDHATLVVARDLGFFANEGLEVELIAPANPDDPPKLVAAGKAEIAISYQPQLHMQVDQGLPLRRIATLVATPLNTLVVLADGPVRSVADLKGRKVGFSVGGFEEALLGAMLEKHGLSLADIELVNVNFSLSPSLIAGQVDAVIGAFRNFELNQMDIVERPGKAFYPEEEGVPVYDELIAVTNTDLLDDPRLPRFVSALERAAQWLVNHPDEGLELFIKAYPDLDDELNRRAWADTLPRFSLSPGAMDRNRYDRFGKFLEARELTGAPAKVTDLGMELAR
ncbi:MAG: ABC transporter substrate-binding protein [Magnetovibrionaceae bacterium]